MKQTRGLGASIRFVFAPDQLSVSQNAGRRMVTEQQRNLESAVAAALSRFSPEPLWKQTCFELEIRHSIHPRKMYALYVRKDSEMCLK